MHDLGMELNGVDFLLIVLHRRAGAVARDGSHFVTLGRVADIVRVLIQQTLVSSGIFLSSRLSLLRVISILPYSLFEPLVLTTPPAIYAIS